MAELRRSLSHEPGAHVAAFPYVERYTGTRHALDAYRKALYLVAGLFALHPDQQKGRSFAAAYGRLSEQRKRSDKSEGIERRFIALLSADAESLPAHIRQAVSLLVTDKITFDYVRLLSDLAIWLDSRKLDHLDNVRQRWAQDFYRASALPVDEAPTHDNSQIHS
jgi:CRISPR system Cascade subunit CasB